MFDKIEIEKLAVEYANALSKTKEAETKFKNSQFDTNKIGKKLTDAIDLALKKIVEKYNNSGQGYFIERYYLKAEGDALVVEISKLLFNRGGKEVPGGYFHTMRPFPKEPLFEAMGKKFGFLALNIHISEDDKYFDSH